MQPGGVDSLTLANERIATAMVQGSQRFDWVHRRLDNGSDFHAEVLLSAMQLEGKTVLQAVVRDIGARKQAEADLRLARQLLDSIVENMPAMVFLKRASDLFDQRVDLIHYAFIGRTHTFGWPAVATLYNDFFADLVQ